MLNKKIKKIKNQLKDFERKKLIDYRYDKGVNEFIKIYLMKYLFFSLFVTSLAVITIQYFKKEESI